MNRTITAVFALFLVGCGVDEIDYPLHYKISDNMSSLTHQAVVDATDAWNSLSQEKLGHPIFIYDGVYHYKSQRKLLNNDTTEIYDVVGEDYDALRRGTDFLGITRRITGPKSKLDLGMASEQIEFVSERDGISQEEVAYETALHELGHCLGLHHSDIPGDLMYPSPYNMPQEITPHTVEKFCEVFDCK